jgi:LacI family transcriptional regulator
MLAAQSDRCILAAIDWKRFQSDRSGSAKWKGKMRITTAQRGNGKTAVSPLSLERAHGGVRTIGVYLPTANGTFHAPILQAIHDEMHSAGIHMALSFGGGHGDARRQARAGIDFLAARGCDGLLVMNSGLDEDDVLELKAKRSRVVIVNQIFERIRERCFPADHVLGGRLAAQALLKNGHRKIAVIAGPSTAADNVDRINGFVSELARAGIDVGRLWIVESDFTYEGGVTATAELLASAYEFTAIFCANDEMAIGALSCLRQRRISVPEDVSVIGYDNTDSAIFAAPRLTSVHIPMREIALGALSFLINQCYGMTLPVARCFDTSVVWRASVAAVPARKARRSR